MGVAHVARRICAHSLCGWALGAFAQAPVSLPPDASTPLPSAVTAAPATSLAVEPKPVGAAEVRQRPDFALARRHGVPPRDPSGGIIEAEGAPGRGAEQPAIRGGEIEDALRAEDTEADHRIIDRPPGRRRVRARAVRRRRCHRGHGHRSRRRSAIVVPRTSASTTNPSAHLLRWRDGSDVPARRWPSRCSGGGANRLSIGSHGPVTVRRAVLVEPGSSGRGNAPGRRARGKRSSRRRTRSPRPSREASWQHTRSRAASSAVG